MPCTWNKKTLGKNILKIEDSRASNFNAKFIYVGTSHGLL
jgi:hypothetical protein